MGPISNESEVFKKKEIAQEVYYLAQLLPLLLLEEGVTVPYLPLPSMNLCSLLCSLHPDRTSSDNIKIAPFT